MKKTLHFNKSSFRASFIYTVFSLLLLLLTHGSIKAQKYYTAERSFVLKLGTTLPLYESISISPTDSLKLKERKANKPKFVPNFAGRRQLDFHSPEALPKGADPLFNSNQSRLPENEILPIVNFEGITEANTNSGVPDVNGDIGKDYYVEIVNATYFRVYDKTGQAVSNLISANSIWSQVQQSSAGDPIILYDQEVDRWFLTEFPSNNRVLIAISLTGDPRGSWDVYTFQTPRFPDFPKYGIWPDSYFLSTNEFGADFPIYAINRQDLLAGVDTVRFQRLTVPKHNGVFFEVGQPVDWEGMNAPPSGSPGIVVKLHDDDWGTTDHDHIIMNKIYIDWTNADNSNIEILTIPTAPFDTDGCLIENTGPFSCVPQPNGQGIDGAEWIITNKAQYRNFGNHESIVFTFMVDVTGQDVAGIRWIEFRKTSGQEWKLYQEGTVGSDDGINRFMSSIGIDGQGNIALGYSVSGFDKFPSLRYTGRYATDPLGEMTFKEFEFASGKGSLGTSRFGDYASMSVDPTNDQTFWFAGEYVLSNGNWSTRVVAFNAFKDTIDIFPVSLAAPQNSPYLGVNEPLTICILNRGLNTVYDFNLGYQFEGGAWIEEPATIDSLLPDSTYCHTFQAGLTFDAPGNYNLIVATVLVSDRNHRNDTLSFLINKPAFKDIALEYIVPGQEGLVCSSNSNNSILLRNVGVDTITSALIQVSLENVPVDTLLWTGELAFGEESVFNFNLDGLIEGLNHIEITLLEINQASDEIPSNNEISWTLTANPEGEQVTINLITDNFPQETTWELVDELNHVLASAGPFSEAQNLYSLSICLDREACYTFIIYDAFGDGISAQGVEGYYEIINSEGEMLASIIKPKFGSSEANQFCLTGQCFLELEVGVEHESMPGAGDAFVIGVVSNGLGTILYSIDGGLNFQSNSTFLNVSPGDHTMIAIDDAGCQDTVSFTVLTCTLQTLITTLPATGGDVGEIHISVSGGIGVVLFSLNGATFVSDTIFQMLEPGEYIVVSRDSIGCERTDTVTVSTHVSTSYLKEDHFIQISPNPGHDLYQIMATFNSMSIFIDYSIFSGLGEPLFNGSIVKYDDRYKGELSLTAYPPGVYYIAFYAGGGMAVRRVIKAE